MNDAKTKTRKKSGETGRYITPEKFAELPKAETIEEKIRPRRKKFSREELIQKAHRFVLDKPTTPILDTMVDFALQILMETEGGE